MPSIDRRAVKLVFEEREKIKEIVDSWHEERYDTDWDTLQESLMKIYKLVHKH